MCGFLLFGAFGQNGVFCSGFIAFWLPVYMQTFCPMKLKDFPFDVQDCEIAVASWTYDVRQLRILPNPEDASLVCFSFAKLMARFLEIIYKSH